MIRRRWMQWGAVGAVAAVALTGCVGDDQPVASEANTSTEPSVGVDLQAEAEATYEGYLDATTSMWREETIDYTLLTEWASDEVASEEAASQQDLRESGVVSVGPMTLANLVLSEDPDPNDFAAYVCVNFAEARHLDSAGNDITPEGSADFAPLHVGFERTGPDGALIVSNQEGLPSGAASPCAS